MNSSIKPRASQIRCYKCGDVEIAEICHHCGRAMCDAHTQPNIPRWIGGKHSEFKGMSLEYHPAKDEGKHCEDCLHFSLNWKFWVIVYMVGGGVSTLVFIFQSGISRDQTAPIILILGLLAGAMFGWAFTYLKNDKKRLQYRPPIPIMGRLMYIKVKENINGTVVLDKDGRYRTSKRPRFEFGEIEIQLKLNSLDRERVKKYRGKHTQNIPIPLPIHAGYLILHGKPRIKIHSHNILANYQAPSHTLSLDGNARQNTFLMDNQAGNATEFSPRFDYKFYQLPSNTDQMLPVQIIPRVVRQGNGWSLELLVQVTPGMANSELLEADIKILELTLHVTSMWGMTKSANDSPSYKPATKEIPQSILTWENLKLPLEPIIEEIEIAENIIAHGNEPIKETKQASKELFTEKGRRKFFVIRFENSITPKTIIEPLTGRLKLRFGYAFSGIQSLSHYYPTGKKQDLSKVKKELWTNVTLDFTLFLNGLCFQEPYSPPMPIIKNEIPPDYLMIKKLSDKLAEDGVYVQRIIENEPRTNKASAKIINRYWRMEGRKYVGLYPIDFHIVITGRENYVDADVPDTGETSFEVKVFAMVFNNKMRYEVDNFVERMGTIMQFVLGESDVKDE